MSTTDPRLPQRIDVFDTTLRDGAQFEGIRIAAPKLVDNPDAWLAFTDLVMIDPIGTGWSRTAKADDRSFWNVAADAEISREGWLVEFADCSRVHDPSDLEDVRSVGELHAGHGRQALEEVAKKCVSLLTCVIARRRQSDFHCQ